MKLLIRIAALCFLITLLIISNLLMSTPTSSEEVDSSIPWDYYKQKRESLTLYNYLLPPENSSVRDTEITHIMIHFISNVKEKPHDPYRVEDIYYLFKKYQLSSHFLIDREGNIFRMVPEYRVAYHAGTSLSPMFSPLTNMNNQAIGIELMAIGTKGEMTPFIDEKTYNFLHAKDIGYTDAQYESLNKLLSNLYSRYHTLNKDSLYLIGHDEYAPFRKTDPGELFNWSRIEN